MYYDSMIETEVNAFLHNSTLLAETTKTLYEYFLRVFFDYTSGKGVPPEAVDQATVAKFLNKNLGWSSSSRYNAVAAIKTFYRWKFGEGHPVMGMKVRRSDPGPQRTMTQEELINVMASIDTSTARGIRDLAIITLMVDSGMRASEVCQAELKNLEMRNRRVFVIVKGGDWQTKRFYDYTSSCIESWLAVREKVAAQYCQTVFTSIGGKTPGSSMTRSGMYTIVRKVGFEAELDKPITPHAMRRTFATIATENGAPSRMVQQAGGWHSIRMVERYTRTLDENKMRPYSPINSAMGLIIENP